MTLPTKEEWEFAAGLAAVATLGAVTLWLILRRRPTPEELERARRDFLVQSGRIVDGMLLDVFEVDDKDGSKLTMLLFDYRIGGVDYECSQDITHMSDFLDASRVPVGFPCSVRYQPGNPQNSIVVAEHWTGLRENLPVLPEHDDHELSDVDHLHSTLR
jgi:hypothetical protein